MRQLRIEGQSRSEDAGSIATGPQADMGKATLREVLRYAMRSI